MNTEHGISKDWGGLVGPVGRFGLVGVAADDRGRMRDDGRGVRLRVKLRRDRIRLRVKLRRDRGGLFIGF